LGLELSGAPPKRVSFIGDCQAGAFNCLLLRDPNRPAVNFLATTHWNIWFRNEQFFTDGRFSEFTTRLLWETRCIRQAQDGAQEVFTPLRYRAAGGEYLETGFTARPPEKQPTLVVSSGVVDACDLDDELYSSYIGTAGVLPESFDPQMLADLIAPRCAPLFAGLRALRNAGVERLFLLAVPPPSAVYERHDLKPLPLRRATRVAFNEAYGRFCAQERIGFLHAWDELAPNGIRDERAFNDEHHLSAAGAVTVLNALYPLL
jgi:hypothetical protein